MAVIGGGPAGATAARLLVEWGRSVVLLTRRARQPLAESVPPSTSKVLDAVGALSLMERGGFPRATGNTSWWDGGVERVERFGNRHGWQVLRADLEAVLVQAAAASGVCVREESRVRWVRVDAPSAPVLGFETAAGACEELIALCVLDASGRAGVLARAWRRMDGPRTLAVSAAFRRAGGFTVPDDTHTLVEAHADGWAWSVPVTRDVRHFTVMLDPPPRGAWPRDLTTLYWRELARAGRMGGLLDGAESLGAPWAADASTYTNDVFARGRLALLGDAASFIDPLSSFGVKKALFSGWLGAIVAHTILGDPGRGEMAGSFFKQREHEVYSRYAGEAARYAEEAAARFPTSRFWRARAAPPRADPEGEELAADEAVRACFERMKTRRRLRLSLAPGVRLSAAPAIVGREIALADALVDAGGRAVQFVEGVSASRLARLASEHEQVGALFESYNRGAPPVALAGLLRALATLEAAGFLRNTPLD